MIITIDGPTASGKSTLAQKIANKLGIYYLNSGFLYRGLAYILVHYFHYNDSSLASPEAQDLNEIFKNSERFSYSYDGQNAKILFDGHDITANLKTAEIDYYSSVISSNSKIREFLHLYQRDLAKKFDLVAEGRDCGSVVFPNADIKIFLTASVEARAKRWQNYMSSRGKTFSLEEAINKISDRDNRDMNRTISPLKIPENAIVIDDSNLNKDELFKKVHNLISEKSQSSIIHF